MSLLPFFQWFDASLLADIAKTYGGVFAMVNPLLKAESYAYYLRYSEARILVTHASVLPEIGEAAHSSAFLEGVLVVGDGDRGGGERGECPVRPD